MVATLLEAQRLLKLSLERDPPLSSNNARLNAICQLTILHLQGATDVIGSLQNRSFENLEEAQFSIRLVQSLFELFTTNLVTCLHQKERSMTNLMDVGDETLSLIFDFLTIHDCARVSQVSRTFNSITVPKIWKQVRLPMLNASDEGSFTCFVGDVGFCNEAKDGDRWFHFEHTEVVTVCVCCSLHCMKTLASCFRIPNMKKLCVQVSYCGQDISGIFHSVTQMFFQFRKLQSFEIAIRGSSTGIETFNQMEFPNSLQDFRVESVLELPDGWLAGIPLTVSSFDFHKIAGIATLEQLEFTHLKRLNLHKCQLPTDEFTQFLNAVNSLEELDLSDFALTGQISFSKSSETFFGDLLWVVL
jgi:hypothetical protein